MMGTTGRIETVAIEDRQLRWALNIASRAMTPADSAEADRQYVALRARCVQAEAERDACRKRVGVLDGALDKAADALIVAAKYLAMATAPTTYGDRIEAASFGAHIEDDVLPIARAALAATPDGGAE